MLIGPEYHEFLAPTAQLNSALNQRPTFIKYRPNFELKKKQILCLKIAENAEK